MSAIEAVTGHYRNQLSGGLQSVEVPEWEVDGKPLVIWFKPTTNPKTQETLSKLFNEKKPIEATVQALIIRALNEDGTPMFKSVHKTELMNYSHHQQLNNLLESLQCLNLLLLVQQGLAHQ